MASLPQQLFLFVMGGATLSILVILVSLSHLPFVPIEHEWLMLANFSSTRSLAALPTRFHYVFSTGCSAFQDWQSYAFFYHMLLLNTTANVTRVASGCNSNDAAQLDAIFEKEIRSMSDRFHLHQTPDFSKAHNGNPDNTPYKFFNKPMGLKHWFDHGLQFTAHRDELEDVIFIILDPDEFVLRPFTDDYTNEDVVWHPKDRLHTRIAHGQPMAQLYGYGSGWASDINMDGILQNATAPSPVRDWTMADIENHYAAGPPYMATGRDMYAIVSTWADFAVEVYRQTQDHLSEMFAYSVAAAHLNLPHQLAWSFMVSNVAVAQEGWAGIDAILDDQVCRGVYPAPLPQVLHYCQRYMLGPFVFSKYPIPKNFLSCQQPLLALPNASFPGDLSQAWPPDGKLYQIPPHHRKRHAFMICELLPRMNAVATFWKDRHCDKGQANYQATHHFPRPSGVVDYYKAME